MTNKILLSCLPPTMEGMPSPAFSVLKPYLEQEGYIVEIEYWNIRCIPQVKAFLNFDNKIYENEYNKLLPFYGYLAIDTNDDLCLDALCYAVLSVKPQLHSKGVHYIKQEFKNFYNNINSLIDNYITENDLNQYLYIGFSSLFYQWIIATIFAKRIKNKYPDLPIVVGGTGTKKEAYALLQNFACFDFVSWGEGEYSLKKLSDYLSGDTNIESIPHTAYRISDRITSSNIPTIYATIDNTLMNFEDYFRLDIPNEVTPSKIIPIEGGRGCHWKKCHFCFLNTGYKTRTKSVACICNEIRYYIEKYNSTSFLFLDNDIIGSDMNRFDNLLDELIKIKNEYNDLTIIGAEIVTKDVSYDIIKKMGIANFTAVQIGYESPSDSILRKIEKKNTFASNLFFIKWATHFGIIINGANVLRNLIEETEEDIKESIKNLYYQRFFIDAQLFTHNHSQLGISDSSKYYNQLKQDNKLNEWNESNLYSLLPYNYIHPEDKYTLIINFTKAGHNQLWDVFENVEKHYIQNSYEYKLFVEDEYIYYREIYNGLTVNEIEFNKDDMHWKILTLCNKSILSIDSICKKLMTSQDVATSIIQELATEGLLYHNVDLSENISIINTDLTN